MFIITKIFCYCQSGMTNTKPCTGWFIHLSEQHYHVFKQTGFFHIVVQLIAFTATFPYPAKHTYPFVVPHHIVYHLCKQNCFANTCTAKQSSLSATLKW